MRSLSFFPTGARRRGGGDDNSVSSNTSDNSSVSLAKSSHSTQSAPTTIRDPTVLVKNIPQRNNTNNNMAPPTRVDKFGTLMDAAQWKKNCQRRGVCPRCENQTHRPNPFTKKMQPLNNEFVQDGRCLRCQESAAVLDESLGGSSFSSNGSQRSSTKYAAGQKYYGVDKVEFSEACPFNNISHTSTASIPTISKHEFGVKATKRTTYFTNHNVGSTMSSNFNEEEIQTRFLETGDAEFMTMEIPDELEDLRYRDPDLEYVQQSMMNYPQDLNTQILGCRHIRNAEFIDEGIVYYIEAVMSASYRHSGNKKFFLEACGALWRMSSTSPDAKRIIGQKGLLTMTQDLAVHSSPAALMWACGLIASLAVEEDNAPVILDSGVIEEILKGFYKHSKQNGVLEYACKFFWRLGVGTEGKEYMHDFKEFMVINTVIKAMEKNVRDPHGLEYACRFILNYEATESQLVSVEGITRCVNLITYVIRCHPQHSCLQFWAWHLLHNTYLKIMNVQDVSREVSMITTLMVSKILRTMQVVQETGCRILWILLTRCKTNKLLTIKQDGVQYMVQLVEKKEILIKAFGCALLFKLSMGPQNIKLMINKCGGTSNVIEAMVGFPDDKLIQGAGCCLLANLSVEKTLALNFENPSVINTIIFAADNHEDEPQIASSVCGVFFNLAANLDKKLDDLIIEAILRYMKRHTDVEDVQIQGCLALGNLFTRVDYLKTVDCGEFVEFILEMTEAFPKNSMYEAAFFVLCGLFVHGDKMWVDGSQLVIQLVLSVMKKDKIEADITRYACGIISSLAVTLDVRMRNINRECIDVVLSAISNHYSDALIQEWACIALSNLMSIQAEISDVEKAYTAIFSSMKEHKDVQNVQKEGCIVLWIISKHINETNADDFAQNLESFVTENFIEHKSGNELGKISNVMFLNSGFGFLHEITANNLISLYLSEGFKQQVIAYAIKATSLSLEQRVKDVEFYMNTLGVLLNLSSVARDIATVVMTIDSISKQIGVAQIEEKGCEFLSSLKEDQIVSMSLAIKMHVITVLVDAMAIHPFVKKLQSKACVALFNFAIEEKVQTLIIGHGGILMIVNAMKRHKEDGILQGNAMAALCRLIDAAVEAHDYHEVVPTVLRTMHFFPHFERLQVYAFRTLDVISQRLTTFPEQFDAKDILCISSIMNRHIANSIIQEYGLDLLRAIFTNRELHPAESLDQSIIDSIINSMLSCIYNPVVQNHACDLLIMISTPPSNIESMTDKGVIYALTFTMQAHHKNMDLLTKILILLEQITLGIEVNKFIKNGGQNTVKTIIRIGRLHWEENQLQEKIVGSLKVFAELTRQCD